MDSIIMTIVILGTVFVVLVVCVILAVAGTALRDVLAPDDVVAYLLKGVIVVATGGAFFAVGAAASWPLIATLLCAGCAAGVYDVALRRRTSRGWAIAYGMFAMLLLLGAGSVFLTGQIAPAFGVGVGLCVAAMTLRSFAVLFST